MFDTPKRVALGVAMALPVMGVVAPSAAAETDPAPDVDPNRQCVARPQTPQAVRSGEIGEIRCFPTFKEAMASVGISVDDTETASSYAERSRLAAAARQQSASSNDLAMTSNSANCPTGTSTNTSDPCALAVHYYLPDWAEGDGSSYYVLTFTGSSCGGGFNFGGSYWDNRIASTKPGMCPRTKHYEQASWQGSVVQTTDWTNHNLTGAMYRATSSVTWLAS